MADILVSGGSGNLGNELQKYIEGAFLPKSSLNVLDKSSITQAIKTHNPKTFVHLAAYTSVAGAEVDRENCWELNVSAVQNVVEACVEFKLKMVFLSTDYVFDGTKGYYGTEDLRNPINYYGYTKMVAEDLVGTLPEHLIIRTSFKASKYPYKNVVQDMWTSADYIDVIAPLIASSLNKLDTIHIGTERKNLFDLIKKRNPEITPITRADVKNVKLPADVSLI